MRRAFAAMWQTKAVRKSLSFESYLSGGHLARRTQDAIRDGTKEAAQWLINAK